MLYGGLKDEMEVTVEKKTVVLGLKGSESLMDRYRLGSSGKKKRSEVPYFRGLHSHVSSQELPGGFFPLSAG